MLAVDTFRGEQEPSELTSIETAPFSGVDLWSADVLRWVGGDPPVDVGESLEPAHR